MEGVNTEECLRALPLLGKAFQNLKVSSPAPVTIFSPHGLMLKYSTRRLWPVSV